MAKKPATATATAPERDARPKLVKMKRGAEYPLPHECDCHPDEVENFKSGGWQEA